MFCNVALTRTRPPSEESATENTGNGDLGGNEDTPNVGL